VYSSKDLVDLIDSFSWGLLPRCGGWVGPRRGSLTEEIALDGVRRYENIRGLGDNGSRVRKKPKPFRRFPGNDPWSLFWAADYLAADYLPLIVLPLIVLPLICLA